MIDSHVHFWNFDPIRDSWITPDMAIIRKDFMPTDFVSTTRTLGISGCIAVQADQTEDQNYFLLSLAAQNQIIKGIVGWVDLKNPALEERLTYWKQYNLIKGWRHVLQAENESFILDPIFVNGVKTLAKYNYTYDLLCYHNQLPAILKLIDQLPDQPLILDHCGKPDVKKQDLIHWEDHIKILSQNPNIYCKISGLLTEADWYNWTEKEIFNCFDIIFNYFDIHNIVYGSDWPVVNVSKPYKDWFELVLKYVSSFSQSEQELIFEENAKRFYKL